MKTADQIVANIELAAGWERIPGVSLPEGRVAIDPAEYFFRFEQPAWRMIPWDVVQLHWEALTEDRFTSLEQTCLEFIQEHSFVTYDAGRVLENAAKVYAFLYSPEQARAERLDFVTAVHLQALRETSTMMALNAVAEDGQIRNVGPAWFFPVAAQLVFGLSDTVTIEVDELYHGGFFHEGRRADSVRAHTALGGRLVHGCSGSPDMAGGAVAPYGASVERFHLDLESFRDSWMRQMREW